jgi:acetyltransferase-like isoleucine patch superfamily enzyme
MVHCNDRVDVGENATVAERSSVIDSDHTFETHGGFKLDAPVLSEPIVLGPFVHAGANVVILRGARVGAHCVIGAGAVVRGGDYPAEWLIAGVPAKAVTALRSDVAPA